MIIQLKCLDYVYCEIILRCNDIRVVMKYLCALLSTSDVLTPFLPFPRYFRFLSLKISWSLLKEGLDHFSKCGYVIKFQGWCVSLTLPMLHCYSLNMIISLLLFQDIIVSPNWHLYICVSVIPILFYSIYMV